MSSKSQYDPSSGDHTAVGPDTPFENPTEILLSMQDVVGRKWHPVILYLLSADGPLGFSTLKDRASGVSSKMLSESLDSLEADGLVAREIVSEQPFRVEYSLTDPGESLAAVVSDLVDWGGENAAVVDDESSDTPGPRAVSEDGGRSRPATWETRR